MWSQLKEHFKDFPVREKIARLFLEYGIRVDEKALIYCANIELQPTKIARALNVDRRAVIQTAETIRDNPELRKIFGNLKPTADMEEVARHMKMGVIEVYTEQKKVGVLAKSALVISEAGININQVIAEDEELHPDPKIIIVTSSKVPGEIFGKLTSIDGVRKVVIY